MTERKKIHVKTGCGCGTFILIGVLIFLAVTVLDLRKEVRELRAPATAPPAAAP